MEQLTGSKLSEEYDKAAESEEELKSLLMMVKEESERASLKLNIKKKQQLRIGHPVPSLHGK